MFSRCWKMGVAALTLAMPLAFTNAADAHPVHAHARHAHHAWHGRYAWHGHQRGYRVMFRHDCKAPWRVYGAYGYAAEASRLANQLRTQGCYARVVCR